METVGPKIGDAASLWNFTPSPGWTREEVYALKVCLMKFGIGKWVQIVESGVLPGKLIQQLNGQTQRLLGQQSLAAFTGLHIDIDRVRADNEARQGPETVRKSGLIINQGGKLSGDDARRQREENQKKYGLSPAEIAVIEVPEPVKPKTASATMARGKFKPDAAVKGLTVLIMSCDAADLRQPSQKLALLCALRRRLLRLTESLAAISAGRADPHAAAPSAAAAEAAAQQQQPKAAKRKPAAAGGRKRKSAAASDSDGEEYEGAGEVVAAAARPRRARGKGARWAQADPALGDITNANAAMEQLLAMGFDKKHCAQALEETEHNVEAAVAWLFANST